MAKKKTTPLPETIIRLGWISFLTDIASEMIYPVLPLFLTGSLCAPATLLGLVEGFSEALVCLLKGLSGWHSDRSRSRVPFVRWGYACSIAARPLLGLAASWPLVLASRAFDRFGKGLRTSSRDALIASAAPPGQKGRAFGYHRSLDTAGAVVGIASASFWLAYAPGHYREIFFWSVLPGIAALLVARFLREPATPGEATVGRLKEGLANLPRSYWSTLGILAVFAMANSSDMFLLLRARQLGLSDARVVGCYGLFYLSYALVSYPAGVLSDRWGRAKTLGAGWLVYAFIYLGFAYASANSLYALFLGYGVYMGLSEGVGRAWLSDHSPRHLQGTGQGVSGMLLGATTLVSSLIAGGLWDLVGPRAPFFFGGTCALLSVCLLLLLKPGCFVNAAVASSETASLDPADW
ncbi:MFS transporter [bacterium]|nr:MFS transporter [bacterium]